MPYIKMEQRQKLDDGAMPQDAGELNYAMTRLVHRYLEAKGLRYSTLNEIMGVFSCAAQEFYRRWAIPYEDSKIRENGDVAPKIGNSAP
ncbi:MAG TPA: hypothetical protein VJR29_09315 [bacterium]|nr:hypothetical protein [bacterium]